MYSINFRLRTEKLKTEKRKVYVRLKIDGVTATDFATSVNTTVENWDKLRQTIKGKTKIDLSNKAMLLKIESDLIDLIRDFPSKSAKEIRDLYIKKELPPATIFNTYQKYIIEKKEVWNGTEKELSKNTIQRWYNCLQHLKEFLKNKDIDLKSIDSDFANRLYLYLIKKQKKRNSKEKISHDFAVRNITYLNNVIDFAKSKLLIPANVIDIEGYKRNKPKQVQSLTSEQLKRLQMISFRGVLEDTRIIFLSMCFSGLNYCDLKELQNLKDKDNIVLRIERKKNKKYDIDKAVIPVTLELRNLLEKLEYKLPIHYHINVINKHLKVFESLLNVNFTITTYTARKTAAMLLSEKGVSIDVISKILGHTSIITTQRYYVKVSEKRVIQETKHLTEK